MIICNVQGAVNLPADKMACKILINNVDNHAIQLVRGVANLFQVSKVNSTFSDVRIKVDNQIFYCHRLILQLNSEYLASLSFKSGCETLRNISNRVNSTTSFSLCTPEKYY